LDFAGLDFSGFDFADFGLLAFGPADLVFEDLSFEDFGFGIAALRRVAVGCFVAFRTRLAMFPPEEA